MLGDRARRASTRFRRSASASAARSRCSARATDDGRLRGRPIRSFGNAPGRHDRSTCCSASRRRCCATCSASRRALAPLDARRHRLVEARRTACCASRRSPTRRSSSRSATAPSAACARATRWSARGRCRSPTARSRCADFDGYAGEAMAMGERTPLALLDAPASGRMAVGEAITNIAAARIARSRRRQAVGELDGGGRPSRRGRGALRHGARGRRSSSARRSASSIPVGKDSLSMRTRVERRRTRKS